MKKILIVDDEPHVARVIRLYLQNAGYEVTYCKSSQEALETYNTILPDLIITDIKMPKLTGPELIEKIRETDVARSIPVIMMTSCLSQRYKDWSKTISDLYFVGKPVSPKGLIHIIDEHIVVQNDIKQVVNN